MLIKGDTRSLDYSSHEPNPSLEAFDIFQNMRTKAVASARRDLRHQLVAVLLLILRILHDLGTLQYHKSQGITYLALCMSFSMQIQYPPWWTIFSGDKSMLGNFRGLYSSGGA